MAERTRRLGLAVAAASVAALAWLPVTGPAGAAAPTGACRSVEDGSVHTAGGPERATVVVDAGNGAVWSACISFSGTISGITALDLASRSIPGLDPVYDLYAGQGRAVCRLLGVGNEPPDCLGKSEDYWAYHHDGRYSSLGAGSVTVADGDVEGWRWGSGSAPRRATRGSEAVAYTPPPSTTEAPRPTAPPATAAPVPTSGPIVAPPVPGGTGGSGSTPLGGSVPTSAPASSTVVPSSTASSSTPEPDSTTTSRPPSSSDPGGPSSTSPESAASYLTDSGTGSSDPSGSSSGWLSALAFVVVVAAITGLGLLRRARRPAVA